MTLAQGTTTTNVSTPSSAWNPTTSTTARVVVGDGPKESKLGVRILGRVRRLAERVLHIQVCGALSAIIIASVRSTRSANESSSRAAAVGAGDAVPLASLTDAVVSPPPNMTGTASVPSCHAASSASLGPGSFKFPWSCWESTPRVCRPVGGRSVSTVLAT